MDFTTYKIYWEFVKIGLVGLSVFAGVGLALSIPLWLLWNWLMPHIFGLPAINILEAFGLSAIVTLLAPRPFTLEQKQKVSPEETIENAEKILEDALKKITSDFQA
tara:strand:- start:130 stop:447 length:318 start_codon:yes stop_codon:yes gene_type:complete